MASLTPLSKGLIGLAVLGGMASAAWHLYLKDRLGGTAAQPAPAAVSTPMATDRPTAPATVTPTAPTTQAMPTTPTVEPPATPAVKAPNAGSAQTSGRSAAENAEAGRKALAAGDFAQARANLEQAVQDGDAGAACLLGEMTLKGQGGIAASQDKAAKLFQLAQSRNTICFTAGQ